MSRSRADISLTIRSPILMVPAVGFSRPAIILSAVVFPQPEEPTRIMNSPSATSSDSSSTAVVPPGNALLTASRVTPGMSLLYPGERDRGDEPSLRKQEHGEHRYLTH